ncbi:MAG: L-arabinose isomerase, partial [Chloroflexota bacterium]
MTAFDTLEVWFITGSQHLYGPEALAQVAQHSEEIAAGLDAATTIPVRVVYKPVLTTADEIRQLALAANHDDNCIGVIAWMHTFSPAKNWIAGLTVLNKPMAHLHTQYNRDIPWSEIDMDFMNLNQAAHGDREFGFMVSRLRMSRKVIVGHWQNPAVQGDIGAWARVAVGWREMQNLKVARIGDNMRYVAVTEGDKVEAQVRFGWEVNGYGIGDLVDYISDVSDTDLHALIDEYADTYTMSADLQKGGDRHDNVREAARIELGLRAFLDSG